MTPRRAFLKQSAVIATALNPTVISAEQGEVLPIALIGCGGQGTNLLTNFLKIPGLQFQYVCDPDEKRAQSAADRVMKSGQNGPKIVSDLRRVLEDPKIQAVIVATPDHWHAPASILACESGKHVYVEKPCSHNILEGRLLVESASRNKRIVQHGTQSRSMELIRHSISHLHQGIIGKVLFAKAFNIQKRADIGHAKPSSPPEGFDYDLWTGPAPKVPFQSNRHHYTWHWWHDFGTGDMGNDGVHELDIARWGLGVTSHPNRVAAVGGKYYFDDDQQFPDTQNVLFEYKPDSKSSDPKQLMFEMRIWSPYSPDQGIDNGNMFYGTEGWMLLSKKGIVKVFDKKNKEIALPGKPEAHESHQLNFIEAIRNKRSLSAPIDIGHISASLCHLGNISTRLGRSLEFNPAKEIFDNDIEANTLLTRKYREAHWAIPKGV
jgi:predicted dehydrogenase